MSDIHLEMQAMFVVWVVLVVLTVYRTMANGSVGLSAALLLAMSFLYGGCFVYAVPGYTHLRTDALLALQGYGFTEWDVLRGTFASLLGVFGFAVGSGAFQQRTRYAQEQISIRPRVYDRNVLKILTIMGIVGFSLHFFGLSFPMSSALNEAGRNVAVAAIVLGAYLAYRDGKSAWGWVVLAAMIPLYYLLLFGFVSYGFLFSTLLASFWVAQIRKKNAISGIKLTILSIGTIYLLLTLFVGWMSFRDEIRLLVWHRETGSIWGLLISAIQNTELFSLWNFQALDQINLRLNLPFFIGRMIGQHELNPSLQLFGQSLVILPLVLVPRFLWPGKPERGGSDFMELHSGITLSDSATFGTGSVFEFYLNFGYIGVFLCFIVLGWIVRKLDRRAAQHLNYGDLFRFARLYVVGVVAVDPLLRPFFIVNSAVFAWLVMTTLNYALARYLRRRPTPERQTGSKRTMRDSK